MSRFTETKNNVFDAAGITLKQAQLLEYMFLYGEFISYKELAEHFDTTHNVIGRMVAALRRKGMANRSIGGECDGYTKDPVPCDEWEVYLDGAAWDLRKSFKEWDAWLHEQKAAEEAESANRYAKWESERKAKKARIEPAHWCVVLPVKTRTTL
jgi:hypothetical protein